MSFLRVKFELSLTLISNSRAELKYFQIFLINKPVFHKTRFDYTPIEIKKKNSNVFISLPGKGLWAKIQSPTLFLYIFEVTILQDSGDESIYSSDICFRAVP